MIEQLATSDPPSPEKTSRRRWLLLCLCAVIGTTTLFGLCLGVINYWANLQGSEAEAIPRHGGDVSRISLDRLAVLLLQLNAKAKPPVPPYRLQIWLGFFNTPAERQRKAVEAIRGQGGCVEYDYEWGQPISKYVPPRTPPGPEWLRNLIGIDYLATVVFVSNGNADHISLSAFPDLPHVTRVLIDCRLIDGGWEPLERMTQIQDLRLLGPNITELLFSFGKYVDFAEVLRVPNCPGYCLRGVRQTA